MAGHTLHVSASLKCPHGASVMIVPSNLRAQAGRVFIATKDDTFTIIGCPFQLPTTPPTPSPCLTVRWVVFDQMMKANGAATLSQSSVGICYSAQQAPQGTVIIENTQTQVSSK